MRRGTPTAFDRVLATQYGVKAFEMVRDGKFGRMAAYRNNTIIEVPLLDAISEYNFVDPDSFLVNTARVSALALETREKGERGMKA